MTTANITRPQLSEKDIQRFWSRVDKSPGFGPTGDCWKWKDRLKKFDYGHFASKGRVFVASRIMYFLVFDHWSELLICHSCDNPPCVNPNHLFKGTQKENNDDKITKGRMPMGENHCQVLNPELVLRGERNGCAKLTDDKVRWIRTAYVPRTFGLSMIAEILGVDRSAVWLALKRKTWKHVT